MITTTAVLGWLAIGAAASLAGMILPFRRGLLGVALNLVAGTAGAFLAPLLTILVLRANPDAALSLLLAAAGALLTLGLVHVMWAAWAADAHAPTRAGFAPVRRR